MDRVTLETTIKKYGSELDLAASIARAAQMCADTGDVERGVEIALDGRTDDLRGEHVLNRINKT